MAFKDQLMQVGWKEWGSLLELNTPFIKVKIDTGAKTSALHAYDVEVFDQDGIEYVRFTIHPIQNNDVIVRKCSARIMDIRKIKSSSGHSEDRIVIRSPITIGGRTWDIDITLTNRDIMNHRMLLGREAMQELLVYPQKTYCQGKVPKAISIGSCNV
jgi:hypothetical protein